jgi:hypothetical protein
MLRRYPVVSPVVTDLIKRGSAFVIASHGFTIDDAGTRAQAGQASTISGKR